MDGVIADTAPFHFLAWQQMVQGRGRGFTKADFDRAFGKRNPEIIADIFGDDMSAQEVDDFANEKEELFRQLANTDVKPFEGVLDLMTSAAKAGWKMAVASSTPAENIALLNSTLGIASYFDAVVSSDDVSRGKPDPDVFLLAAQSLGEQPDNCVVIEDTVAGIHAARNAGMKCIAVTNTHPAQRLVEADRVVASLGEINISMLDSMLK